MKKLMTVLCLLALAASGAAADVLWDQSNWDTSGDGLINMAWTTCSMINGNTKVHQANDVTFATDVVVSSVTIYETEGNGNAASATQAYLWIAPRPAACRPPAAARSTTRPTS